MQYRRLGRSGLQISSLVLGSMNFGNPTDAEAAAHIIDAARDAGINLIDCADVYAGGESEKIVGRTLKKNKKRHEVLLTSKVYGRTGDGPNDAGTSKHHIFAACESSLRRLQTDYIDIYFLHRTDFNLPQEETLAALDLLVHQGKVRYIGCSTFPAWRVVEALWLADKHRYPKFVSEQPPYNLLDRRVENEIIPMCRAYDLGLMTWSPLAQGVLAGRYRDAAEIPAGSRGAQKQIYADRISAAGIAAADKLALRAAAKGCSLAQLALAWILHQKAVTAAIIGPRTRRHLDELLPAVDLELDDADFEFCDTLIPPGTHVSDHFNTAGWQSRPAR